MGLMDYINGSLWALFVTVAGLAIDMYFRELKKR